MWSPHSIMKASVAANVKCHGLRACKCLMLLFSQLHSSVVTAKLQLLIQPEVFWVLLVRGLVSLSSYTTLPWKQITHIHIHHHWHTLSTFLLIGITCVHAQFNKCSIEEVVLLILYRGKHLWCFSDLNRCCWFQCCHLYMPIISKSESNN